MSVTLGSPLCPNARKVLLCGAGVLLCVSGVGLLLCLMGCRGEGKKGE